MGTLLSFFIIAAGCGVYGRPQHRVVDEFIDTVDELQLDKYIGRWNQMYGNRFGWLSYGDQAMCSTADYYPLNATGFTLVNANRQERPDGEFRSVNGTAWREDPEGNPGVFKLKIFNDGDYWVAKLGPATYGEQGLYEYSVISNPTKLALFVIARDVEEFKQKYDTEDLEFLEEQGFNEYFTRPIPTPYHGPLCLYRD